MPVTTSVKVAEVFEKEHKNVMQSINTILSTLDSIGGGALNFQESNYLNKQNKKQPMFIMDRDAFSILVFGFTGEKALGYRIDFVKAFNASQGFSKIS